ncbi:hypothetical protein FF100_31795 [Methylobacterium terricola]|uniref:Uncharacterized protein n=1 Tax=Methylobacterium terricola TaxID=2583531 RepID=A0A5C4L7W0_9HYPH|nr:hypothetical protein [Methylobacterium terricola]TNC07661.1 hypothetical protein FF100_31795 [Methylobacterium terricola]
MPRYRFSLVVNDRCVESGIGIELANESAALAQAWHIGKVLLSFPGRCDAWRKGVLIIDAEDGKASFALSMADIAGGGLGAGLH